MRYPLAIHKDSNSCYGVTIPDLPGCFAAGGTIDSAVENARQAIAAHLEILAEEGTFAPLASELESLREQPDYAEAAWVLVDVDVTPFLGKTEKATVTLPKLVIRRIDRLVAQGVAKSRSAFLADSAIKAMAGYEQG